MTATTIQEASINIRLPQEVKERAVRALEHAGMSLSQAVRLFVTRLADGGSVPLDMLGEETPNAVTQAAMRELENGGGVLYKNLDELFSDAGDDDAPAQSYDAVQA